MDLYDVPIILEEFNFTSFTVDPQKGLGINLPCGIKIIFPINCLKQPVDFFCKLLTSEEQDFITSASDQLLSDILKIGPNGSKFEKVHFRLF